MKKTLSLSSFLLFCEIINAQVSYRPSIIKTNYSNIGIQKNAIVNDVNQTNLSFQQQVTLLNVKKTAAVTENVIGKTYYDLQSNNSVGDRIFLNEDGTIAACWTFEPISGNTTYPNRGTGYAYFDGANWSAQPTVRVENDRTGWGNIAHTRSGKEFILSHNGGAAKLHLASRNTKGTGTWANSTTAIPTATTGGNFWPRMVTSGDTIYTISVTSQVASGGALWQGLDGAVVFSRSKDGGVTWDITNLVPTGLTSATFRGFSGDSYAIAAKGSTVAILAGDSGKDLVLTKSTDAGATWTSKTVLKFPLPLWNYVTTKTDINNDGIADTLETNDGSLSVGLDNNGLAYAFYGTTRILNVNPSASGYTYFPYTDGLYMWNENMSADVGGDLVAAITDLAPFGTIEFPTQAVSGTFAFGLYGTSLTSFPSVTFDEYNTMYLSYSSIVDGLISLTNDQKLLRHIYLIKSCDGGANWTEPLDVVGLPAGIPYEGVYASTAKRVDGNIHLVYQRDLFPGFGVPLASGTSPDADNIDQENEIIYLKVPVSDLGNCLTTGIKESTIVVDNLNFYPNPTTTASTLEVYLNEKATIYISILNNLGQTISDKTIAGNSNHNKIDFDFSNLTNGLYFYQIKVEGAKTITRKFVIEK